MDFEPLKMVVVRAIFDAQKRGITAPEGVAQLVLDRLQVAADLIDSAVFIDTSPNAQQAIQPPQNTLIAAQVPIPSRMALVPNMDLTRRFSASSQPVVHQEAELIDNYTKQEISDYLRENTPPKLAVEITGGVRIELHRMIEQAPGDLNFVRLSYRQPGQVATTDGAMFPIVQVVGSERTLDAKRYLTDIEEQARLVYSATPRTVTPHAPPPRVSLGIEPGAPTAETDAEASAEDIRQWGPMSAAKFAGKP